MPELILAYWPYILAAFLIGIAVAWFAFKASRKTSVTISKDVLDDDAGPATRNQALIDAPVKSAGVEKSVEEVPVAEAVPEPAPKPAPKPAKGGDDLTQIKGLGPKLAALLNEQGITSFAQIADWNDADIARVDATLGRFEGRITRDSWVEQAKHLSAGDTSAFADKFGNNG
ncbi:MAG: helix-hairpin-helix domain-containing protein [Erythrobacter sp.]